MLLRINYFKVQMSFFIIDPYVSHVCFVVLLLYYYYTKSHRSIRIWSSPTQGLQWNQLYIAVLLAYHSNKHVSKYTPHVKCFDDLLDPLENQAFPAAVLGSGWILNRWTRFVEPKLVQGWNPARLSYSKYGLTWTKRCLFLIKKCKQTSTQTTYKQVLKWYL